MAALCVPRAFLVMLHANSIRSSKYFSSFKSQFSRLFQYEISQFFGSARTETCIENIPLYKLTHVFVLFRLERNEMKKKGDTRKLVIFAIFRCIKSAFLAEKLKTCWMKEARNCIQRNFRITKRLKNNFESISGETIELMWRICNIIAY